MLNRFEQVLDLFDAEMTAAVLNAHKVGVMLVREAARENRDYYPTLIDMIANAMGLAARLMRMTLEQYRVAAVIEMRQFFDLAETGARGGCSAGGCSTIETRALLPGAM